MKANHTLAADATTGTVRRTVLFLPARFLVCLFCLLNLSQLASATPLQTPLRATRPELVLQTGHTMRVDAVAFGGGGRWLASGSADNTTRIWDAVTGRELRTMSGESGWVKAIATSRDNRLLAAGNLKGTCKVWDAATGREVHTLAGHTAAITSVAFSPDGRVIATGSADNTIKLWDIASGRELRALAGHAGWVTALAFSPDNKLVASGSADKTIKLWESGSGATIRTLTGHTERIGALAFSADGARLASGGGDGAVKLWQVAGEGERRTFGAQVNGQGGGQGGGQGASPVLLVAFDADGALVSGAANKVVVFWDAETGRALRTFDDSASLEKVESIAYSPEAKTLALGSGNKTIALWDVKDAGERVERTLKSTSSGVYSVIFSDDKRWFATAGKDRTVKLWEASSGRNVRTLAGHTGWVTTLAFSPDSELVAAGSLSGEIKLWDVASGREMRTLTGHTSSVNGLAFSSNKILASASGDGTIRLWDVSGGNARTLEGHTGEVHSVAFSSDGKLLASGGADKTVKIWDAMTGNELRTLAGHTGVVYAAAFSSDGKMLATGDGAGKTKLWNTGDFSEKNSFANHTGWVTTLAFSRDNQLLASGGQDKTLVLTNLATNREVQRLTGHSDTINAVAFYPANDSLASSSEDGSTRVWNAKTGSLAATLVTLSDSDEWVVVAPDGLFDGTPAAWNEILWRFRGDTFAVAPVEIFFNEFYYPGLLGEILTGRTPRATASIEQKDRRQPGVRLALADAGRGETSAREVTVKIEVAEAAPDAEFRTGGGARDVRLFRNGLLVKVWRDDIKLGQGNKTVLETNVPVVAGENRFTAYAFNRDNIKSADSTLDIRGAESLRRDATAYIVAVGINSYANSGYDLKLAVPDANDFAAQVRSSQENLLGRFARIETVSLLDKEATKANIILALKRLAGDEMLPTGAPPALSKLKAVQPEDTVVFYFAGHGLAHQSRFYLLPHDLGYAGSRRRLTEAGFQTILTHSISDRELEQSFERVGASQILFVIDACNSGQALEAEEKRRGPMNSRGLAQLAYEKGMYILTAAQSYQAAQEVTELGHGLLTYALVEEGLRKNMADAAPRDGRVMLVEWLNYATARVPQIQLEKMQTGRSVGVAFVEGEEGLSPEQRNVQRPRVFYRRDTPVPLIAVAQRVSGSER